MQLLEEIKIMKLKLPKKQTIYLATSFDQLPKLLDKLVETYEPTDEHLADLLGIAKHAGNVHVVCWFPDENAFKFTTGFKRSIVYDPNCCDAYELRGDDWFQIHIEGAGFLTNQMLADGIVDAPDIRDGYGIKRMLDIYDIRNGKFKEEGVKRFINNEIKKSNKKMNEKFIKKMNNKLNKEFIEKQLAKLNKTTDYIIMDETEDKAETETETEAEAEAELEEKATVDDLKKAMDYMINDAVESVGSKI